MLQVHIEHHFHVHMLQIISLMESRGIQRIETEDNIYI